MKVQFLRDHLNNVTGDVIDIADGIASYLIRMGAVQEFEERKKEKQEGAPQTSKRIVTPDSNIEKALKDEDGADVVEKIVRTGKKEKRVLK